MFMSILAFEALWLFLLPVCFIASIVALEWESSAIATFTYACVAVIFYFATDGAILNWIMTNPVMTVMLGISYFVIGACWSVLKFKFYCNKNADNIRAKFLEFGKIKRPGDQDVYQDALTEFKNSSYNPVRVSVNKSRIYGWMTFWVSSMIWTILNDPIRYIWKWTYRQIATILEKISNGTVDSAIK